MNNWIAKNIIYRGIQLYRQEPVFRKLKYLNETQWLPLEKLEIIQIERLRKILISAYENTIFYKRRFDKSGFDPHKFQEKKDLLSIPFLEKKDIQSYYGDMINHNYQGKFNKETTSGSTGVPFSFLVSRGAAAGFRGAMYREHEWFGIGVGEKEARFYGMPMDTKSNRKERLKDYLMNRKRFSVFKMSDADMEINWAIINEYKPAYIYGYTSSVFRFSDYIKRKKIKPDFKLKAVIVTSEVLSNDERIMMEDVWGTKVVNEYGSSETGIIANECPEGRMHLTYENNYVEFINNNQPARENQSAEIVITNLENEKMPLIRYKIGDVGSYSKAACGCGRKLPLMNIIEGRLNNMVQTPDGKVLSGLVFYYVARSLLENKSSIQSFVIYQKALDHIHFVIVKGPSFSPGDLDLLKQRTHEYIYDKMKVDYEFVAEIPQLPSGKLLHFISELDLDIAGNQYRV